MLAAMFLFTLLRCGCMLVPVLAQGWGGGSALYPLSTDSQFSFSLQTTLASSDGYGANTAEVLTAAANVTAGDFESYYKTFNYLATRIYGIAESISSEKYPVSAREALFRSANYFRAATTYLYGNISDPRIYSLWDQQTTAFNKAISLLPVPGYRVMLPGPGFDIPVIFYPAPNCEGRRPTILAGSGYDGAQEDSLHSLGFEVLSRGYNFATYEGPGQPTVRRDQQIGFIPQWHRVVTPVVDYLTSHPQVDPDAIALVGISFGGTLAPLAAAYEHRLAAVIALDGLWSMFEYLENLWPAPLIELYKAKDVQSFDEEVLSAASNTTYPTSFRWFVYQGLWAFNTRSPYSFVQQLSQFTLTKELLQNISAPVFVGMGLDDGGSTQAPEVAAALGPKATLVRFGSDIGSGEHCQLGAESRVAQATMDWFQGLLDTRKSKAKKR